MTRGATHSQVRQGTKAGFSEPDSDLETVCLRWSNQNPFPAGIWTGPQGKVLVELAGAAQAGPSGEISTKHRPLAQSVEHRSDKAVVGGSSPPGTTKAVRGQERQHYPHAPRCSVSWCGEYNPGVGLPGTLCRLGL